MHQNSDTHVEMLALRKGRECHIWYYRLDQVPQLYRALQKAVCDPHCTMDWSDLVLVKTAVRERLRNISEARP